MQHDSLDREGGVRAACGYGCVAHVVMGHRTYKVMFHSDDLFDIGRGLPLLGEHLEKALGLLGMEKMERT